MSTIRKLVSGIERKYIRNSILSPLFMIGEVVMEVIIPFIMAKIIDLGIANRDLPFVAKYGILMIGLACFSLLCGMLGTVFSTTAIIYERGFMQKSSLFHLQTSINSAQLHLSLASRQMSTWLKTFTEC